MRTFATIIGVLLILAAAAVTGQMLGSNEPFEPLLPCALALFGTGIFGLVLFVPINPPQADQCTITDGHDSTGDFDADGD